MRIVKVKASSEYNVYIGSGILMETGKMIREKCNPQKIMVVTDDNVAGLYLDAFAKELSEKGFEIFTYVIPHGENNKNMGVICGILEKLADSRFSRNDILVALGGGITGDMGGFAASVYLRGIDFVQVSTTLLSDVDSSVGGKTGVNLQAGKNLAGAFKQPLFTLIDTECLKTLPDKEFVNGLAEVIKYGMIADPGITEILEKRENGEELKKDSILLEEIIEKCVKIKAGYVERDEFDRGERHFLNFGHTVGHGIEKVSGYTIEHGFAVGIGMAVMIRACERKGICETGTYRRFEKIMKKYGLPVKFSCPDMEKLKETVFRDKKSTGHDIITVLPEKTGKCMLERLNFSAVADLLECGMEEF